MPRQERDFRNRQPKERPDGYRPPAVRSFKREAHAGVQPRVPQGDWHPGNVKLPTSRKQKKNMLSASFYRLSRILGERRAWLETLSEAELRKQVDALQSDKGEANRLINKIERVRSVNV